MSVTVELGFGFGPGDTVSSWTDVSAWIEGGDSDEVVSSVSGRDGESISPGSAVFTLDNSDGRFDPRNTAGPYYGLLDVGVPVRISDESAVLWSGFVASGWPQQLTARFPTVTVTAHDTFGAVAQGTAPETALAAVVASLSQQPDRWWRPGEGGWIDVVTGGSARHTGGLTQVDPIVNGDDQTWGQDEPDGYGVTVAPTKDLPLAYHDAWTVCSAWVRTPRYEDRSILGLTGEPYSIVVADIEATFDNNNDVVGRVQSRFSLVLSTTDGVSGYATGELGDGSYSTALGQAFFPTRLFDGGVHHIHVAVMPPYIVPIGGATGEGCHIWVDGVHVDGFFSDEHFFMSSVTSTPRGAAFGSSVTRTAYDLPYQGVIDHVMLWSNVPDTSFDDLDAVAQSIYQAGRFGWAGQRLDERTKALLGATSAAAHLGAFNASGITTLQSYRSGDILGLLQTIEDTEQGRIWCDRYGDIRFSSRRWPWTDPRSMSVQATFSDRSADIALGAIEMLDAGTVIADDPLDVVNVAQVTSAFGRMQTAKDQVSIGRIGQRQPVHLSGLLHRSDNESLALAQFLLLTRSTPRIKVKQVSFAVESDRGATLPFAADATEGDLVRVVLDAGVDVLAHVRRIQRSWSSSAGQTVTLSLDATLAGMTWFEWGTSTWSGADGWAI